MKHTDLAVDYFERHSTSQECHITSDGRVFHTSGNAISFANEHGLQDTTIESYTREQVAIVAENEMEEQDSFKKRNEIREKLVSNYTQIFGEAPADNLEIEEIEKIIAKDYEKKVKENDDKIILEKFQGFDIETGDYQEVKAFIKHFNIETTDQKADTLKTALTEFKNNLAQ